MLALLHWVQADPSPVNIGTVSEQFMFSMDLINKCRFIVLSTFLRIPGYGNILLDVGEGTWGQMARNFGLEGSEYNVWHALRDLRCIFVSHMHADHHIGLAHILSKRRLVSNFRPYFQWSFSYIIV